MTEPKTWKAGLADETWKVIVSARDTQRVSELIAQLSNYLTDAGSDMVKGRAIIRTMTGAQIIDALETHIQTNIQSIEAAIKPKVSHGQG